MGGGGKGPRLLALSPRSIKASYVGGQANQEIIKDGHPVVVISGRDIAMILIRAGFKLLKW